jgi:hypothetical protein
MSEKGIKPIFSSKNPKPPKGGTSQSNKNKTEQERKDRVRKINDSIAFLESEGYEVLDCSDYDEDIMDSLMENVPQPICPLNMYFEGDEDRCDTSKCNFDEEFYRSCSYGCIN